MTEVLKSIIDPLKDSAGVQPVFGETRYIPIHDHRKMIAVGVAGLFLGLLWARSRKSRSLPD